MLISAAFFLLKDLHCLVSALIPTSRDFKILDSICYQWERWSELPSLPLSKGDVSVISMVVLLLNSQLQHGISFPDQGADLGPCTGSSESYPLNQKGSPCLEFLK